MAFDPQTFLDEPDPSPSTPVFDPAAFLGVPKTLGQQQLEQGLLGGEGRTMSKDEAFQKAMDRIVKRSAMEGNPNIQMVTAPDTFVTRNLGGMFGIPTPGQKNVVDVSQLSGAMVPLSKARAFSSGQTLGATDALERLLQDALVESGAIDPKIAEVMGVKAQRAQNPADELALNIAGGLAPGPGAASAIRVGSNPRLAARIVQGLGQGLVGGGIVGLNEALTQEGVVDPSKTLESLPGNVIGPALIGGALGGGIPALGGLTGLVSKGSKAVTNNATRSLEKEFEDVVTDVVKPKASAQGDLIRDIETGSIQDSLRSIQANGKPTGLVDMLEKSIPASEGLSTRIDGFIKANPKIKISNSDIADEVLALANSNRFRQGADDPKVLNLVTQLRKEGDLRSSFDDLNKLNELRRSFYNKSATAQLSNLDILMNELEQHARDRLSGKLDDVYRGISGNTDNPYQQYGALKGLIGDLTERGDSLITDQRIKRSKGPSLEREVLATIKANANLLTGGELARIDRRVVDMFDLLDSTPQPSRIRTLTPEEQAAGTANIEDLLRQGTLRNASTIDLPQAPLRTTPTDVPLDPVSQDFLNQMIQQANQRQLESQAYNQSILQSQELRRRLEDLMNTPAPAVKKR